MSALTDAAAASAASYDASAGLRAVELEDYADMIEEGTLPREAADPARLREAAAKLRAEQAEIVRQFAAH